LSAVSETAYPIPFLIISPAKFTIISLFAYYSHITKYYGSLAMSQVKEAGPPAFTSWSYNVPTCNLEVTII